MKKYRDKKKIKRKQELAPKQKLTSKQELEQILRARYFFFFYKFNKN